MQSSTTVMFRGLVMLACLVAIPLAAVVGKSLPDLARGLLSGRWPGQPAPASGAPNDAPPFVPAGAADFPEERLVAGAPAPQSLTPDWGVAAPDTQAAATLDPAVIQASSEALTQAGPMPAGPLRMPLDWPTGADSPWQRDAGATPAGQGGAASPAPTQPAGPNDPRFRARVADGQFAATEQRLRELGATYYLLESWGNQEQLYRFYCRVAVGGNANYIHYFEATDCDPLAAMAKVLQQVETWRAAKTTQLGGWRLEQGQSPSPLLDGPT